MWLVFELLLCCCELVFEFGWCFRFWMFGFIVCWLVFVSLVGFVLGLGVVLTWFCFECILCFGVWFCCVVDLLVWCLVNGCDLIMLRICIAFCVMFQLITRFIGFCLFMLLLFSFSFYGFGLVWCLIGCLVVWWFGYYFVVDYLFLEYLIVCFRLCLFRFVGLICLIMLRSGLDVWRYVLVSVGFIGLCLLWFVCFSVCNLVLNGLGWRRLTLRFWYCLLVGCWVLLYGGWLICVWFCLVKFVGVIYCWFCLVGWLFSALVMGGLVGRLLCWWNCWLDCLVYFGVEWFSFKSLFCYLVICLRVFWCCRLNWCFCVCLSWFVFTWDGCIWIV